MFSIAQSYPAIKVKVAFAALGYFSLSDDITADLLKTANNDPKRAVFEGKVRWLMSINQGLPRVRVVTALTESHENFASARQQLAVNNPRSSDIRDPALVRPSHIFEAPNRDTRSPPDVSKNSHIIAICGVNDAIEGEASPAKSGWMVSDFYLWKQVLTGMGKSQTFLTCDDPRNLVKKYIQGDKTRERQVREPAVGVKHIVREQISWSHGYLHGDPWEDRRVVLDKDYAGRVYKDLTYLTPGTAAKQEYLTLLDSVCAKADRANEPVIAMIFAHGALESDLQGGVNLCLGEEDFEIFLTADEFAAVVNNYPKLVLTLFMTSCYSGHWVEYPRFQLDNPPALMAGSGPEEETFSYALSHSQRHCGGFWTAAALKELMKGGANQPILPSELDEPTASSPEQREYVQLQHGMISAMRNMYDITRYSTRGSTPVFDQNEVNERFDIRTGFPIANYMANYSKLKVVPASDPHPSEDKSARPTHMSVEEYDRRQNEREAAWFQRHPEMLYTELEVDYEGLPSGIGGVRSSLLGYGVTGRGLRTSAIPYLARCYYNSCAPRDWEHQDDKAFHLKLKFFVHSKDDYYWQELATVLAFRVAQIEKANRIVYKCGLKFPRFEEWKWSSRDSAGLFTPIQRYRFFDRPEGPAARKLVGRNWLKPYHYLAAAFYTANYYGPGVKTMLDGFLKREEEYGKILAVQRIRNPTSVTSTFRKRLVQAHKNSLRRRTQNLHQGHERGFSDNNTLHRQQAVALNFQSMFRTPGSSTRSRSDPPPYMLAPFTGPAGWQMLPPPVPHMGFPYQRSWPNPYHDSEEEEGGGPSGHNG